MSVLARADESAPLGRGRVLIVDDSAVARSVVGRMIDGSGRFDVAAAVDSVAAALAFLSTTAVDFVLLDIAMPGVDGLTALPDLVAAGGNAKVIVVSASATEGAAATVQALALGAVDTLVKPGVGAPIRFAEALLEKLDRLADRPSATRLQPAPAKAATASSQAADFDVVAIGASTGGIHALGTILRALPAEVDVPILVTQHLPATFIPYFAAQLALLGGRPCDVATERMRVRPGRIIVAPGDAHISCFRMFDGSVVVRLDSDPMPSGCQPSADPMLASLGHVYGARGLGIVLSGMGRDGAGGAKALHEAGGTLIVQDEASSVVWGMPRAVAAQGIAAAMLPPEAIGAVLAKRLLP